MKNISKLFFVFCIALFAIFPAQGIMLTGSLFTKAKNLFQSKHDHQKITNIGYAQIFDKIDLVDNQVKSVEDFMALDIKGLIVHINSPGGLCASAESLKRVYEKIREVKCPVVVLIENICLSAAYLLATGADHIIAHSLSEIGFIGVLHVLEKRSNVKLKGTEDADIEYIYISNAKYKIAAQPYAKLTEEYLELQKKNNALMYDTFCELISDARGLSMENRDEWADARTFIAQKALSLGLIDSIGSFYEAQEILRSLMVQRFGESNISDQLNIIHVK